MGFKNILLILIVAFFAGAAMPFIMPDAYTPTGFAIQEQPQAQGTGASVDSGNISAYFCPEDKCALRLAEFYGTAQSEIHVMIYSLTKEDIAQALVDAKNRGVEVKVLIDVAQAGLKDAKDEFLLENGIELKRVSIPGYAIFHDKVSIVDGKAFSTGSFNYTNNADSGSAENLVIIKDGALAQRFEQEFQKYWSAN